MTQNLYETPIESPSKGAPNAGGVAKTCVFRPVEKSSTQTHYRRKFRSIRHGCMRWRRNTRRHQQRWWRSKFVRNSCGLVDIYNVGCRGSLSITSTTHFSITSYVTRASHARCAIAGLLQRCVYKTMQEAQ